MLDLFEAHTPNLNLNWASNNKKSFCGLILDNSFCDSYWRFGLHLATNVGWTCKSSEGNIIMKKYFRFSLFGSIAILSKKLRCVSMSEWVGGWPGGVNNFSVCMFNKGQWIADLYDYFDFVFALIFFLFYFFIFLIFLFLDFFYFFIFLFFLFFFLTFLCFYFSCFFPCK